MTIQRLAQLAQHTARKRWLDALDRADRMPENAVAQIKVERYHQELLEIERIIETEQ